VGEDSRSSFAGQYRTVLNVRSHQLLDAYKEVLASKYAPEALYYRIHFGLTDVETPMAVLVLEMIDSRASGVMYTTEVGSSSTGRLEIRSIWGLGELLVQGEVSPDRFRIEKGVPPKLVEQRIRPKAKRMAFDRGGGTRVVDVDADSRSQASLDEALVLALARWGMELEAHYGEPQDVEWCLGPDGRLFLLQARPLKTGGERFEPRECPADEIANPVLLAAGKRASPGVGAGSVCHVRRTSDLDRVPKNAVLVSRHASARYVRILGKLSAVVTETGSTAGHFSSVAREFGVPAIVNASGAMDLLKEGVDVTVHADERKVYQGIVSALVESPCVRKDLSADSPYARRLEYVIRFTSPLRLMDPEDAAFSPGGCRSMHDIIRFAHEKSVQEMFTIGERKTGRRMGARKLLSDIPLPIYLLDLDGGIAADSGNEIEIADVKSAPFLAVWKGLNHPNIQWSHFTHYNWEEYDRIVMSGGFVRADSAQLASYAVLSREYLNLNLKFGYHFVILDTICSERSGENHIRIRFTGGGGDLHGRCLRADFVSRVLERLGFEVSQKSDLVDADLSEVSMEVTKEKLDWTGRLLGATRLMDMYLKEEHQVDAFVDDFVNGRYHFSTVAME
jgi:pyruvate,water dikinase